MRLLKDAEAAEGEWTLYKRDNHTGERVEFLIRPVPEVKERELDFRLFGRKRPVTWKKGGRVQEIDVEKQFQLNAEKAAYALVDSRNCELEAGDAGAAAIYSRLLGREVKAGETVKLDGCWTDELKREVLAKFSSLVNWINEKSDAQRSAAAEEEEEAGKI